MAKNRKRGEPIDLAWIKSNCFVDADTGCWIWQRGRNSGGYGQIHSQGRMYGAHCVVFQLAGGIIPPGQYVLHECDRPSCCSPSHLFAGTHLQNVQDMHAKGREARGEKNGSSKLTEEKVVMIRNSPGSGVEKAEAFGVTKATISKVMLGQIWDHVA